MCNSLANANVKVLGDGHMAQSRSISRLEQLDTRMGGTARGFARNFGRVYIGNKGLKQGRGDQEYQHCACSRCKNCDYVVD